MPTINDDKRTVGIVDLSKDFNASAKRLIELKAGRDISDIPITDEYFKAVKKHQAAFTGGLQNGN